MVLHAQLFLWLLVIHLIVAGDPWHSGWLAIMWRAALLLGVVYICFTEGYKLMHDYKKSYSYMVWRELDFSDLDDQQDQDKLDR